MARTHKWGCVLFTSATTTMKIKGLIKTATKQKSKKNCWEWSVKSFTRKKTKKQRLSSGTTWSKKELNKRMKKRALMSLFWISCWSSSRFRIGLYKELIHKRFAIQLMIRKTCKPKCGFLSISLMSWVGYGLMKSMLVRTLSKRSESRRKTWKFFETTWISQTLKVKS